MVVIDFSQLCVAAYAIAAGKYPDGKVDLETFRFMVANSIRIVNLKFRHEFGRPVLAVDSGSTWRMHSFPYYKAGRVEQKQKSAIDWAHYKQSMRQLVKEFAANLPYPVIVVKDAEADDLIGSLVRKAVADREPVLVISADKDFIQLQIQSDLVRQWDNVHDRWVTDANPIRYMYEHIVKGDRGDGIPSALSADDVFVTKTRQKPIRADWLEKAWEQRKTDMPYFRRNVRLIDLRQTPAEIQQSAIDLLANNKSDKSQLSNYFVNHQLKQLYKQIGDF